MDPASQAFPNSLTQTMEPPSMRVDESACLDGQIDLQDLEFMEQIDDIERKLKAEEARYARLV